MSKIVEDEMKQPGKIMYGNNQLCIFARLKSVTRVKYKILNFSNINDKEATIHNAGKSNE